MTFMGIVGGSVRALSALAVVGASVLSAGVTPAVPAGAQPGSGARVEGQRLADFVVGPWEIDPTLIGVFDTSAAVIDGPATLEVEFPPELAEVAEQHSAIDGFSSARWSDQLELQNTVLRFADPGVAAAAATDLADALAGRQVPGGAVVPAPIPGHPQTRAYSNPVVEEDTGRTVTFVRAITAHGPYVLSQRAMAADGVATAATLVAGTLDRQAGLIDQFVPTPPPLLDGIPADPTGLLARTVARPTVDPELPGSYGPHGALHFQVDPVRAAPVFADAGVSTWARSLTGVYETRDPQAAQRVADVLVDGHVAVGEPSAPVAALPGSRCASLEFPTTGEWGSYCAAATGRYAVEADGATLAEAQQRLTEQAGLLAGR
ncbi:DUF7373 family lipoprotein [Mycolicibacterium sp.]|uniref:DUF7373 family lipoprotein n=1 Tax=Mycolicibacterium sp. TaxID=2320850 RepID=UPI003D0C1AB6